MPGRLMPIACLALAGLAALAVSRMRWRWAPLLVIVLIVVDLRAGVTAYRPTAADEGNGAYAELRKRQGGRLLEMPVYAPDRQEASVYLYYAMQAPRERPAGYSTIAPTNAARMLRELQPCADVRHLAELGVRFLAIHGPLRCGVAGRLVARDGPVALYEAFIPVAWQPVEFDTYTFLLLRRGPRAAEYSEEELTELQRGHLAFLERMREEGHLVLAGPFQDQEDETKRGLCIYRTGLDETRRLTEQDPSVRAGRIAVEAMTWLTGKGALD